MLRNRIRYCKDSDAKDILGKYEFVLFVALRWNGDYSFCLTRLVRWGLFCHDVNDIGRMGLQSFDSMYKTLGTEYFAFFVDEVTKNSFQKINPDNPSQIIRQPFEPSLLCEKREIVGPKTFVCSSRPTSSKRHDVIRSLCAGYGVQILSDLGLYSMQELSDAYSSSMAMIDASKFPIPHHRTQYSFLESWYYDCPFMCSEEWLCDEVEYEETCVELNRENVERLAMDDKLRKRLAENGKANLSMHNPSTILQNMMELMNG